MKTMFKYPELELLKYAEQDILTNSDEEDPPPSATDHGGNSTGE